MILPDISLLLSHFHLAAVLPQAMPHLHRIVTGGKGCYTEYSILWKGELQMEYSFLIQKALDGREFAYCPYSGFAVGAALLCSDGEVYTGCNIESSSYSPSNCAERTAFFKAISDGKQEFAALAVIGAPKGENLPFPQCFPCGVCLQVINEFCTGDFPIILAQSTQQYTVHTLQDLLPLGFRLGAKEESI